MKNHVYYLKKIIVLAIIGSLFTFVGCSEDSYEEVVEFESVPSLVSSNLVSVTIQNPGFESGKANWGSNSNYAITSDENSGSSAGKVTSSSGKIEQTVSVTQNTDYELKAWVDGDGKLSIGNSNVDFDTNNYTQVSVTFNSGNTTSVTILGTRDSGDVRFDDFTLESSGSVEFTPQRHSELVGETFRLENVGSKLWARISGTGNYKDVKMTGQTSTGDWPRWIVEEVNDGGDYYYRFKNVDSGRRFRPTSITDSDVYVGKTGWVGNWTQWMVISQGSNYVLVNKSTGTIFSAGGNNNGSKVQHVNDLDGDNTLWSFKSIDAGGDDGDDDDDDDTPDPGNASIPSDLMDNCNQWKITYPDGEEDKTLCGEGNNEYFYVNNDKNGIVFRVPIRSNNGSTPNSENIRSELREREPDGSKDVSWNTDGTNVVYVKQAITHLPNKKDELVATQIHGNKSEGIDDAMVVRLEGRNLFLSFNGGELRSNVSIKTNYTLGTIHETIFEVKDGKHYCYYSEDGNLKSAYANNNASQYLIKDGNNSVLLDRDYGDAYFKIGNYTQSNFEKEDGDTSNNYGEVVVYDFYVKH